MPTHKSVKKGSVMPAKKVVPKKSSVSKRPTKKVKSPWSSSFSRPALFAIGFAIVGVIVLVTTFAAPKETKLERFKNNPEKGWIWDGIREVSNDNSPCRSKDKDKTKDLLELVDTKTSKVISCTHGPDPAPEGVDVKKRVEPLQTGEDDATALARASSGGSTPTLSPSPITCDGDGVSGNRVQAIYARASDTPDRYNQYKASIQAWASGINNVFIESGLQNGSVRSVRFVHDANCYVTVANVVLTSTGDDNISNTEVELQNLGYSGSDRKYMIWMDANVYCGIGDIRYDDRPTADNINSSGRTWARVDNGCWSDPSLAAHELMHNLGGVQPTSPHHSYVWHCTDEEDLMCYDDYDQVPYDYRVNNNLSPLVMTYTCPYSQQKLFDCNDDDYFNSGTPAADNYLATHWNTANNSFLFAGGTGTSSPAGDAVAPLVTISTPVNGSKIGNKTSIKASATDNVGVSRYEIWIDGTLKASANTYSWSSAKASSGLHTITVKAFDVAGNMGQASVSVTR